MYKLDMYIYIKALRIIHALLQLYRFGSFVLNQTADESSCFSSTVFKKHNANEGLYIWFFYTTFCWNQTCKPRHRQLMNPRISSLFSTLKKTSDFGFLLLHDLYISVQTVGKKNRRTLSKKMNALSKIEHKIVVCNSTSFEHHKLLLKQSDNLLTYKPPQFQEKDWWSPSNDHDASTKLWCHAHLCPSEPTKLVP